MKDVEIIGMLKSYINKTLVGMGALKGAPCTVKDVESAAGVHTITLEWTDTEGTKHTTAFVVKDGIDGVSPTITVKTSTDSTYILTITDKSGSFDTPNLKGGGSGGASSVADLTDVVLTDLATGDILVYDLENEKWVNSDILSDLARKATTLAGYGITDAYTKTETDNAITTEIEKLDVSDAAVTGSYVTAVSEADGKITVTREAADNAPTENSNKMVKSGGVYTELAKKADKVDGATNGNFAGLDASGNLIDSGKKAADFATAQALEDEAATRSQMGAKNLVNIADFTLVKSSARTKTINAADIEILPSAQVILSFDVTDSDLTKDGAFRVYGPAVSGSRPLIAEVDFKTNSTYELPFDATNFDQFYIFIDNSDSENATCTISNIMIRYATDANGDYQPYAKTNKQLTDEQGYITAGQWASIQALYS